MNWTNADGMEMLHAGKCLTRRVPYPDWDWNYLPGKIVIQRIDHHTGVSFDVMVRKTNELRTWADFQHFLDDVCRVVSADILGKRKVEDE
jgi:hypothetical protein